MDKYFTMPTCQPVRDQLANPYDRKWVATVLQPLAARAANGEEVLSLQAELLTGLWPWARRVAERLAFTLPSGADRDAVRSEVMWELYQSIVKIDWERYHVWPALLKARIRGAFTAVARAEDPLTRGQRRARKQFLALQEQQVHTLGRMLTSAEERSLAARLCPRNGELAVLDGFRRSASIEDIATTLTEPGPTPEQEVMRQYSISALRDWLENDLPPGLTAYLADWLAHDRDVIPARIRRQLKPYLPALRQRIS